MRIKAKTNNPECPSNNSDTKNSSSIITNILNLSKDKNNKLVLNDYVIEEPIGKGSHGEIHKVFDQKNKKFFAMKSGPKIPPEMKKQASNNKKESLSQSSLENEIEILLELKHPNIVKMVEAIIPDNLDFIYCILEFAPNCLEICEGSQNNRVTESLAHRYFQETVAGLQYLHDNRVIHRDLKPSNLLVDENDHVMICDFGVSTRFNRKKDAILKGALGTAAFLPPEALQAPPIEHSGKALDIWCLGQTLYCLLYGRVPYLREEVWETHDAIIKENIPFDDEQLSSSVKSLLQSMLQKDVKKRFSLLDVKKHVWFAVGNKTQAVSLFK